MCGPSDAMKNLNASIQDFAGKVKSEAGDIFGDASTVFNNIMNTVTGIVTGGPSQFGYSQNELNAKNAAAVNAGAAEARNLKAAAGSSAAAIGGGNVTLPSGATVSAETAAQQKAAADTAEAENAILQGGYETGRENFFKSAALEEQAPNVFGTSIEANKNVQEAQKTALQSQTNIDTQSNWAMNDVMKLGTAAVSAAVGGATGGAGGGFLGGLFGGKGGGGGVDLSDTPMQVGNDAIPSGILPA